MDPNSTASSGPPPPPFKVYLPGDRPNETRGPELLATTITLTTLALTVVGLRLYVRIKFIKTWFTDDYLMALAALVLAGVAVLVCVQVDKGAGKHIEYISPADFVSAMHANFATQPTSLICLGLARLSVAFFLLRFATSKVFKWIIWANMGLSILLTLQGVFQTIFQCQPMAFIWDKSIPGGTCMNASYLVTSSLVNAGFSITADFILAVLPIPMLWNVQMNWRVKSAVMGILSLGFFTVTAAILKTTFITKWGLEGDYMWDSSDITIWYMVEISIAIMAGSIPCLKPLFKQILATTARYGYSGRGKGGSAPGGGGGYVRSGYGKPSPSGGGSNISGSWHESKSKQQRKAAAADPCGDDGDDGFEMSSPGGDSSHTYTSSLKHPYGGGSNGASDLRLEPTTATGSEGRRSQDIIIQQQPQPEDERPLSPISPYANQMRIMRTTQISMSVEEQRERRVKDMV